MVRALAVVRALLVEVVELVDAALVDVVPEVLVDAAR